MLLFMEWRPYVSVLPIFTVQRSAAFFLYINCFYTLMSFSFPVDHIFCFLSFVFDNKEW